MAGSTAHLPEFQIFCRYNNSKLFRAIRISLCMVTCLKVKKEHAESARQFLKEKGWLDKARVVGSTPDRYVILPLAGKFPKNIIKKFPGSKFETKNLQKFPERPGDLKQLLRNILSEKDIEQVTKSYDVVGDIAILEIPKRMEKHDLAIAWALKRTFPAIKVIAKKVGKVGDLHEIYRIRRLKILTGENRLATEHKESGIIMRLDLGQVYFSPRSSHERERIAKLVKPNEKVLVMFAGIGPFALVIAKQKPVNVIAVEKNPDAVKFMEENIRVNYAGNRVIPILGDVREILPELKEKFDRIIMPYPEESWQFLELAFNYANPKATIHFYAFVNEKEIEKAKERIRKIAGKAGRQVEVKRVVVAGSYAPRTWRYCFDILVR